jgi:hypothetical protein
MPGNCPIGDTPASIMFGSPVNKVDCPRCGQYEQGKSWENVSDIRHRIVLSGNTAEASRSFYFFLPDPNVGCHPAAAPFWLGAPAIVLIFSFLGFFFSRLLLCSPLAMSTSFVDYQVITSGQLYVGYC